MSVYPIDIVKVSMDHKDGTKAYHVTLVATSYGRALVIKRWGKKSVFGEILTSRFPDIAAGEEAYAAIISAKMKRGYSAQSKVIETADDLDGLIKCIGRPTWMKLAAADLNHLDGSLKTNGIREPDPPRFAENGTFLGNPEPRKIEITQEMIDADRREQALIRSAENPLYGKY